jgi:hypothetical protein
MAASSYDAWQLSTHQSGFFKISNGPRVPSRAPNNHHLSQLPLATRASAPGHIRELMDVA